MVRPTSSRIISFWPMDVFLASAKLALPQAFSDHPRSGLRQCDPSSAVNAPAQDRIDIENFKKACGNHFTVQAFWFAITGEVEASGAVGGHPREGGVPSFASL